MALTDAISVSAKALGIGADVYYEKDRSKYTKDTLETEQPPADSLQPGEKMNLPTAGSWNYRDARSKFCEVNAISQQAFANIRATLIQRGAVKNISLNEIDPIDFDSLCSAIKATIPEYIAYMDSQRVSA